MRCGSIAATRGSITATPGSIAARVVQIPPASTYEWFNYRHQWFNHATGGSITATSGSDNALIFTSLIYHFLPSLPGMLPGRRK